MKHQRKLQPADVQQNPLILDLFERAKSGDESFLTYDGITLSILPVEDITDTFTLDDQEKFVRAYAAVDDPKNQFTHEQAMQWYRQRKGGNG